MARGRTQSATRLTQLRAAKKRARADDVLGLDALASLWGCSKPNFVKIRDGIPGFPRQSSNGPQGALLYPAREALQALINEDTKEDRAAAELAARQRRILGSRTTAINSKAPPVVIPIGELAKASRLSAEIEERERAQGLYVPSQDMARVVGNVFSMISGALSNLEQQIDPTGELSPPQRALLHTAGRELLLKVHGEMKDMLAGNVSGRRKSRGSRRSTGRPR